MDKTADLARLFALLSDEVRLHVVYALLNAGEMAAGDLAHYIDVNPSNLSNHLRLMRLESIVCSRKQGKQILYSLNQATKIELLLQTGVEFTNFA